MGFSKAQEFHSLLSFKMEPIENQTVFKIVPHFCFCFLIGKEKHRKFQSIFVLKYDLGHLWSIIITARRDIIVLEGTCNPFRNPGWWREMRDLNHDKLMMSNDEPSWSQTLDLLGQFKTFWILFFFFYFPKGTSHCFDTSNFFLWKKYYRNHFSIMNHKQKILDQK